LIGGRQAKINRRANRAVRASSAIAGSFAAFLLAIFLLAAFPFKKPPKGRPQ
jgi:hypothetical protein